MTTYNEVLRKLNNGNDLFYDKKRVAQIKRSFDDSSIMIRIENQTQFNRIHVRNLYIKN